MKKQLMITAVASSLVLSGCASNPYTTNNSQNGQNGQNGWNKTIAGALGGAALGAIISKASGGEHTKRDAAIGAAVGAGVGYYMQQQAAQMQEQMAGTGVKVAHNPKTNNIDILMPSNITFDTNQSKVKPGFYDTLGKLSATLKQYNQTTVLISGHTDSTGSDEYNQNLSEQRAYAVASFLNDNGIAQSRLQYEGHGERYPIADNNTEYGKSQNRRVEIRVNAPKKLS